MTKIPVVETCNTHIHKLQYSGRRGGLMVSELDSGLSGKGLRPGRGHCVVFMGKTLNSHSTELFSEIVK